MSKKNPSEELSWEEAVARFLEDHPDFFARRPDLLAQLRIPHAGRGATVSLIERQVQVLRERNEAADKQLRELIDIARENDILAERLHHFAGAMIDSASLEDVIGTAQELLRQEFRLDAVAILLQEDRADRRARRSEFVRGDDPHFTALLRRCGGRRVVCGGRLDGDSMEFVFGARAKDIQSLALIPLKDPSREGVLAMGSRDALRFHPEMGVVFLVRLGELFMRAAARHLRAPE